MKLEKRGKPKRPRGYSLAVAAAVLAAMAGCAPQAVMAATNPLKITVAGTDFLLPLQKVAATQLYSFRDKKGYPGVETVLAARGKAQITFGAAPVLGSSQNVPFLGFQFRLPEKFFDTSNNALLFGAWVGKESGVKRTTWGIKASIPLW